MLKNCLLKSFLCLLILNVISSLVAQDIDRVEQIKILHEARIASSVIDISGIVVDIEGKKLDGVELSVSYARPKNMWATDSETIHESLLINGDFSIKKKHYTAVTISFAKQGYYPQTTTFYTGKKLNETDSAIQSNLRINLREVGPLPELIKFDNYLDYNIKEDKKSFCRLSDLTNGRIPSGICKLNDIPKQNSFIYLDFARDEKGEIILSKDNARGASILVPQTYVLRFVSSDPQDGLIFLDDPTITDMTYLTEAPLKGYTEKEHKIQYPLDKILYFYIKSGKFYGKGKIIYLDARNNEFSHEFGLAIVIVFNKEQLNRNVRSLQK